MTDFIDQVIKLNIANGDVIVLKVPTLLQREQRAMLNDMMGNLIKKIGVKAQAVILEGGMDISVLRTSEIAKDTEGHQDAASDWYVRHKAQS